MSDLLQPAESQAAAAQAQQRLLQLGNQLAQLQATVDALRMESEQSSQQVATLVQHFTDRAAMQPIYEHLAMLSTALDGMQEGFEQIARSAAQQEQLERLIAVVASQSQIDELADGVKKLTRTQFKGNTLAESKEQQVESALATLRELATRREQIQQTTDTRQSERLNQVRADARIEFGAELLPALDSIDLALVNGEALLTRQQARIVTLATTSVPAAAPVIAPPAAPTTFWQRLFAPAPTTLPAQPMAPATPPVVPPERALLQELHEGTRAWLQGLRLVQDRFKALLAAEEIEPIDALHQPFDPKLHVALEAEKRTDVAPNIVVRVLRQGYRRQDRILRYAEVVVARQPAE